MIGQHFHDIDFHEADRTGAIHGNQFIADLGPRHPLYVSMLPFDAQAALGRPHDDGVSARDMLLAEGFRDEGYVDIFDGGPTLVAEIDEVRTVRDRVVAHVEPVELVGGDPVFASAGEASGFQVARGTVRQTANGVTISPELACLLGVSVGDPLRYTPD